MKTFPSLPTLLLCGSSLLLAVSPAFGRGGGGADKEALDKTRGSGAVAKPASGNRNPMAGSNLNQPPANRQLNQPTNKPAVRQPTVKQPTYKQPTVKQPTYRQPTVKQPSVKQPSVKQPSVKQPTVKPPTYKQPTVKPPTSLPGHLDNPAIGKNKPDTLPGQLDKPGFGKNKPMTLPGDSNNPGFGKNKPDTLPGQLDKPGFGKNKPMTLPGDSNNPGFGKNKPDTLPGELDKPGFGKNKPMTLPGDSNKPGFGKNKPDTLPGELDKPGFGKNKPMTLPGDSNKPGFGKNKPNTLPGELDKPGFGKNKPNTLPGDIKQPAIGKFKPNKPGFDPENKPKRPFDRANWANNQNIGNNNLNKQTNALLVNRSTWGNRPGWGNNDRPWWSGNNNTKVINNIGNTNNIWINNVNRNFQNNWNWSHNQNHWGHRPWWNNPVHYPWYGGHWNYSWNHHWHHSHHYYPRMWPGYGYDNDVAEAIGWGIAAWGLGNLIFQSGYQTYYNPYPAQPVVVYGGTTINYTEPMSMVAAETAPKDEATAKSAEDESAAALEQSRVAFKRQDYLAAMPLADKAVSLLPSDTVLHEYRALVLFALGKYSDAAAVLNSILASGPGWDWTTMVQMYDSQETYTNQLERLQKYATANASAADARFVLGYHYMVCGHLDRAAAEFEAVTRLQPADNVAKQLLGLCTSSAKPGEESQTAPAEGEAEEPASDKQAPTPVADQLVGIWKSDKGKDGSVTLDLAQDGKFTWTFTKEAKSSKMEGEWSMNDKGLLVLDTGDSQMTGAVSVPAESQLRFVLAGGPEGDPGLLFNANK